MSNNVNEGALVTVLMPVYNGEKYIRESIDSVLAQTYTDFEFLIINDGSTDDSAEIVESYKDSRIRFVENSCNLGLVATLNKGLKLARGIYIARMDCDDISLPKRLERQVEFMDAHPLVGVSGTWIKMIGSRQGDIWSPPTTHEAIVCSLLFETALAHPTVIIRKSLVEKINLLYDPSFEHAEDYDLWVRASRCTVLANLEEVHLLYRIHAAQIGERYTKLQLSAAMLIRSSLLEDLGLQFSAEDLKNHQNISLRRFRTDKRFVAEASAWLCRLKRANRSAHIFPEPQFTQILAGHYLSVCNAASKFGLWTLLEYMKSPLGCSKGVSFKKQLGLAIRCCLYSLKMKR